jgi:hypothetical protein
MCRGFVLCALVVSLAGLGRSAPEHSRQFATADCMMDLKREYIPAK